MTCRRISTAILLAIGLLAVTIASTASAGDNADGFKIAEKYCSQCHAIGLADKGRHPRAPAFKIIANRYSVWDLQEALAEGIVVAHDAMPKFVLKPDEIYELLSYMDTLAIPTKKSQ